MRSLSFAPSLKPFLSLRFSRLSVSRTHTKTVAKNKYSRNKVAFEIIQCVKKTRDYADANVFMRPFEIYRAALYNVYGGSRVTDVPYIYNNKHNIWIASICLVYVGLAQARPNDYVCVLAGVEWGIIGWSQILIRIRLP